jgi:hypothetical protein
MARLLVGHFIHLPHMGQRNVVRRKALTLDVTFEDERLAIMGAIWPGPNPETRHDMESGGQIIEEVSRIFHIEEEEAMTYGGFVYADGWDRAKLAKLVAIWRLYHLNDMQAGCEHQRALGWSSTETHVDYGGGREDMVGVPCPICGYEFGSAWLFTPVPTEVREFIEPLLLQGSTSDPQQQRS